MYTKCSERCPDGYSGTFITNTQSEPPVDPPCERPNDPGERDGYPSERRDSACRQPCEPDQFDRCDRELDRFDRCDREPERRVCDCREPDRCDRLDLHEHEYESDRFDRCDRRDEPHRDKGLLGGLLSRFRGGFELDDLLLIGLLILLLRERGDEHDDPDELLIVLGLLLIMGF